MFVVFVANIVLDLTKCTVIGDFSAWGAHLGMKGLKFVTTVMAIYAIMPMLVKTIADQWFRYFVIGVSVFMTLFVAAHEVSHLLKGDKPWGIAHALDVTHHILGVWVIFAASIWARQKDRVGSLEQEGKIYASRVKAEAQI